MHTLLWLCKMQLDISMVHCGIMSWLYSCPVFEHTVQHNGLWCVDEGK